MKMEIRVHLFCFLLQFAYLSFTASMRMDHFVVGYCLTCIIFYKINHYYHLLLIITYVINRVGERSMASTIDGPGKLCDLQHSNRKYRKVIIRNPYLKAG